MSKILAVVLVLTGLLVSTTLASAETIYTRYFESIDGDLESDILQVYSVTALRGEKITLVVYGLEEGMAPAIVALDPTGVTLVEDMNEEFTDVAIVQYTATVDGIYPFVVYRQTEVAGQVRIMVFEGDPIDATTSILDTVDPLLPSRAFLLAGVRSADDGDFAGQPIEFSIQSLPFENVAGADDEELPQPQFFASRATRQDVPELEERLTPIERSDWLNNPNIQLYTLNIRPVPENEAAVQEEVFREGDVEIPTLEQPLLPYDIILTVKPGIDPPIRLERPFCTGTLPLVGRTLIVQNIPGEAYVQLGTISGGDVVEIIGTDATGAYVQITWDDALNGSGWIPFEEVFETGSPECVRVIPVEEDMERLDIAIQEVIDRIRGEGTGGEVAEVPTPQPTLEFTPQPFFTNVEITNVVDNDMPLEGSTIEFTMAVGNFSTSLIEAVEVEILLPIGLTYSGWSPNCLPDSVFPICILGDIPAGEVRGFLLYATVDPDTAGQILVTTAQTDSSGVLLQAFEEVIPVRAGGGTIIYPTVDLAITKTIDNALPAVGDTVTFTLTAINNGPDGAGDIQVFDQLPVGLTYVGNTPSQGTYDSATSIWTIGILQSGQTATLQLQATINAGTYLTSITNTATISAPQITDPDPSNNSSSVSFSVACLAGGIGVAASDTAGLIAAVNAANSDPDLTTICLTQSTYTLTVVVDSTDGNTGLPSVTTPIDVIGNLATISRDIAAPNFRIWHVNSTLNMQDVTLTNGNVGGAGLGGNIYVNNSTLSLTNTTVSNGVAGTGGGILNDGGSVTLTTSTLNSNSAGGGGGVYIFNGGSLIVQGGSVITGNNSSAGGGGIYSLNSTITIDASSVSNGNTGGGGGNGGAIAIWGGTATIQNGSDVSNNSSPSLSGGGIGVISGTLTIDNSTVSGNTAAVDGGGIYNSGTLIVQNNSVITGNMAPSGDGGGIYSDMFSTLTLTGSTLDFNSSGGSGGGVWLNSSVTAGITNTTLDNNSTAGFGGGLMSGTTLTVNGSFFTNNNAGTGGGIHEVGIGTITINSSTISGNTATVQGGGLDNAGTAILDATTVTGNNAPNGAGIETAVGTLTVQNGSQINGNIATTTGGGIRCQFGGTVNITNSTVSGNDGGSDGGGLFNDCAATITTATFTNNIAIQCGGGIHNTGTGTVFITGGSAIGGIGTPNTAEVGAGIFNNSSTPMSLGVTGSSVAGNNAPAGGGGGIFNDAASASINSGSSVNNNSADSGGGIVNVNGVMMIDNSQVFSNTAVFDGGGIVNTGTGTITLLNGSVIGGSGTPNMAGGNGGGIYNDSTSATAVTVTGSTVSANTATANGGGIYINAGAVAITSSTISNNSTFTGNGGGVQNIGILTMLNSTISGNFAVNGGGIRNGGTASISNTTIANNTGSVFAAGLHNLGTLTIKNSIVASNLGGDCAGAAITDQGDNLDTDGSCVALGGGNFTAVTPAALNLGALANNGGLTQTHAVIGPSSAIDAVVDCSDTGAVVVGTDQRGVGRPVGAQCDIGSYEAP